jgi:hypothetical protein
MAIKIQLSEDGKKHLGVTAPRIQKGRLYENKAYVKHNSFIIVSVLEILHHEYWT